MRQRDAAAQRTLVASFIGIVAAGLAGPVDAAQPLATDDAAVLPPTELFRDEPGHGKYQVGVRLLAIPDRFETFVGYGNQLGAGSRSSSVIVGFRAQAPAWAP